MVNRPWNILVAILALGVGVLALAVWRYGTPVGLDGLKAYRPHPKALAACRDTFGDGRAGADDASWTTSYSIPVTQKLKADLAHELEPMGFSRTDTDDGTMWTKCYRRYLPTITAFVLARDKNLPKGQKPEVIAAAIKSKLPW
jgi:hypothetical protein